MCTYLTHSLRLLFCTMGTYATHSLRLLFCTMGTYATHSLHLLIALCAPTPHIPNVYCSALCAPSPHIPYIYCSALCALQHISLYICVYFSAHWQYEIHWQYTTVDNNSALCALRLTLLSVLFCAMGNMRHIVNTKFFAFSAICAPFSAICSILYTYEYTVTWFCVRSIL